MINERTRKRLEIVAQTHHDERERLFAKLLLKLHGGNVEESTEHPVLFSWNYQHERALLFDVLSVVQGMNMLLVDYENPTTNRITIPLTLAQKQSANFLYSVYLDDLNKQIRELTDRYILSKQTGVDHNNVKFYTARDFIYAFIENCKTSDEEVIQLILDSLQIDDSRFIQKLLTTINEAKGDEHVSPS